MKKLVCALLFLIAAFACAAAAEISGDWEYAVKEDGTVEITRCVISKSGHLTIPEEIAGMSVTSIGYEAFSHCYRLTSIIISDSVTTIGNGAFFGCSSLTGITIPDSVTTIGEYAFIGCNSLTNINVSPDNSVFASIDGVLFEKGTKTLLGFPCGKDTASYTVPNGIKIVGNFAFYYCRSLTGITIPDSVTTIGEGAFYHCGNLTSITIPDCVTTIDDYAFSYCDSLTSINVSPDNSIFESIDGVLFNKVTKTLLSFPCGKDTASYTVPNGIMIIGNCAFDSCSRLTSITIPESVTEIGERVFENCIDLTVTTARGAYAAAYCKQKGIRYTYFDANDWLND